MAYIDVEMRDAAELHASDASAGGTRRHQHAVPQQIRAAMHVDQTRTASIFIVADTNIYLHSMSLLERFKDHLGPGCGAVADLGSVGLQCAVIVPQAVWRELDGLKGRANRQAAVHSAIRLVNADAQSERPFFIHQTLALLKQAEAISVAPSGAKLNGDDSVLQCCLLYQQLLQLHQAQQQQPNHSDVLVILTDDENLRGKAHAAGIPAHSSKSLSPRNATALYHQLQLPPRPNPLLLQTQAAGMYALSSAMLPAAQSLPTQRQQSHHSQQYCTAQQQPPPYMLQHVEQQPTLQQQQQQQQRQQHYNQMQHCSGADHAVHGHQQQQRHHFRKSTRQPQVPLLQQHRPEQPTVQTLHTQQHKAPATPQLQPQQPVGKSQRTSFSACSPTSPADSRSIAASPRAADALGSTEWHGTATNALNILLDSLHPAVGAILAHTLGADIWRDCMDPRPPWRTPRDMLMALPSARDSLGMRHADSGDFFRARDELWACANQLRQNRGKDEVAAFVRRVLNACRQMLSVARRCLASHAAAPDWPSSSLDADHLMEQLQADDEHLRGLAKCVPLH